MWDDRWKGKTIGTALDHAARKYVDKVATEFHNGALTYNQLKQTSNLIACGFLKLGVGKGDKVAIWMAGYSEWALVYFALMRLGAIIVPVNTRYRPLDRTDSCLMAELGELQKQGKTISEVLVASVANAGIFWKTGAGLE